MKIGTRSARRAWGTVPVFLLCLTLACDGGDRTRARPSIILLVVDTLRADHLDGTNPTRSMTPALDAMAAESIRFVNCFSQAPWTPPSVATLFTSLPPQVHGLNSFEDHRFLDPDTGELRASVLPDEAFTLAEGLSAAGYRTAAFVANPWLEHHTGLDQGFEVYDDHAASKTTTADAIFTSAETWLESRPQAVPFFLYLHVMDIHEPYDSSESDFIAVRDASPEPDRRRLLESEMPPEFMEVRPAWAGDEMRREVGYWKAMYGSGVKAFDRRVSSFLDYLEHAGILDEAVVVLTSDHGEELFEHEGWGHGESLYDQVLHVPLIVRMPGGEGAGSRLEQYVGLIDLMPSMFSLAGVDRPEHLQGFDISPLFRGTPAARPPYLFSTGIVGNPATSALRTDGFKLVLDAQTGRSRLFDLHADPGELRDLSSDRPDLLKTMSEQLVAYIEVSMSGGAMTPETIAVREEMKAMLQALGYVD